MKKLLMAAGLVIATTLMTGVQRAEAQSVSSSSFSTEVSLLNSQILSGDSASARVTFDTLNSWMIRVLGVTKYSIRSAVDAGNDSLKTYYISYLRTQQTPLYFGIWTLKSNMATNRDSLVYKLNAFGSTIY